MKISIKTAAPPDHESLQESELRIGKDEMNLVEHPFALLRYQQDSVGYWEIKWEHLHPHSGKKLKARWMVQGGAESGLPGPLEEKLYLVLLEITREQNWAREVMFSRGDLIDRLGLTRTERSYRVLTESLSRLASVKIQADRSFWDARLKDYLPTVVFGMISRFKIADEPRGRKSQGQLPLSAFVWDEIVWNSFKAGHLRSLDTAFALSLKLPLSMRLFRYLDKHRFGRTGARKGFEIEIHKLCEVHLGMTASPYGSKLKERLAGAHHELIERGFLSSVVYRKMKTKDGEKVCYSFARSLALEIEPDVPIKAPETAFSGLRAILPPPSSPTDSPTVLAGFMLADEELKAQACDAVFQALPLTEQDIIKSRIKIGLPEFLQENMMSSGAKASMTRGIRKEIETTYQNQLRKKILETT